MGRESEQTFSQTHPNGRQTLEGGSTPPPVRETPPEATVRRLPTPARAAVVRAMARRTRTGGRGGGGAQGTSRAVAVGGRGGRQETTAPKRPSTPTPGNLSRENENARKHQRSRPQPIFTAASLTTARPGPQLSVHGRMADGECGTDTSEHDPAVRAARMGLEDIMLRDVSQRKTSTGCGV